MTAINMTVYPEWKLRSQDPSRSAAISGTLKLAIVTNSYTQSDAHNFWDDVSANEVSGTGYTAGGNACASPTITRSSGTVTFDASDPSAWSQNASGFSNGRRFILYYDTGTGSTSHLVAYSAAAGADFGNVSGSVTFTFNASGIYTS
jgi:hypothetical protein